MEEQTDRDARLARMLDDLDDVESKIEELRPASQVRSMIFVVLLFLVLAVVAVTVLFVPRLWDLAPFLIAAGAYAFVALRSISAKNEELAELKNQQSRITEHPTA